MCKRGRRAPAVLAVLALLVGCSGPAEEPGPAAEPHRAHLTAAGDFGSGEETEAVLEAMAAQDADLALALGDLSYGKRGNEPRWCELVTGHLGADFPFQLLAGNHESDGDDGFIDDFAACLPDRLPNLVGTYARQWYADVPAGDPLVRLVMISPDLTFPDGVWSYDEGTPRYAWTAEAIDGARAAGIPWVVVGAHKPCLTVGVYECDIGADLFQLLLEKKVDLVLHGHEHHYARTHQLALGDGCRSVPRDRVDEDCVRDADASLAQGAGTVFVTVGTGGIALREVDVRDPEWDYFATVSAEGRDPAHGLLDLQLTAGELRGRFVPAATGTFTDAFTIRR